MGHQLVVAPDDGQIRVALGDDAVAQQKVFILLAMPDVEVDDLIFVFEFFGDGFDAANSGTDITKQEQTSGTTTVDNWHTYASFLATGATFRPTQATDNSGTVSGMLIVYSQNPILVGEYKAKVSSRIYS